MVWPLVALVAVSTWLLLPARSRRAALRARVESVPTLGGDVREWHVSRPSHAVRTAALLVDGERLPVLRFRTQAGIRIYAGALPEVPLELVRLAMLDLGVRRAAEA